MQSSFKIIKSKGIQEYGNMQIVTSYDKNVASCGDTSAVLQISEEESKTLIDNYENLAYNIIQNAQRKADKIISSSYAEVQRLQKEACEAGKQQGYAAAYRDGYEKNITKANAEAEIIKNNSDQMLLQTQKLYEDYFKSKEAEIKTTILNITENILKKEIIKADALDKPIFEALTEIKNTKAYIIKVNSTHFENIKQQIEAYKTSLSFKGDIFVIEDETLDDGTAVISRDSGKTTISIDGAFKKLQELFT
jgi:flagellar assembly protein FliH